MIGDAIVAAQDSRGDETEKLFDFPRKRRALIRLVIESEETLHGQMAAGMDFFVHLAAKFLKVVELFLHGSSMAFCEGRYYARVWNRESTWNVLGANPIDRNGLGWSP